MQMQISATPQHNGNTFFIQWPREYAIPHFDSMHSYNKCRGALWYSFTTQRPHSCFGITVIPLTPFQFTRELEPANTSSISRMSCDTIVWLENVPNAPVDCIPSMEHLFTYLYPPIRKWTPVAIFPLPPLQLSPHATRPTTPRPSTPRPSTPPSFVSTSTRNLSVPKSSGAVVPRSAVVPKSDSGGAVVPQEYVVHLDHFQKILDIFPNAASFNLDIHAASYAPLPHLTETTIPSVFIDTVKKYRTALVRVFAQHDSQWTFGKDRSDDIVAYHSVKMVILYCCIHFVRNVILT